jgi:threonine dehydrogenase-like Zn-dependent dehydrogenase
MKSTYSGRLNLDAAPVVVDELTIIGSRCGPFAPALDLLTSGAVDVAPLVSDRLAIDDGLEAFERATRPGILKVLVDIGES